MRLIDADALIEHLKEYKTIYGVPMTDSNKQVIHYIIGHIKNIEPTAYDVEAVVAELEKEKAIHTEHFHISLYKDYPEIKQMYEKVCLVIDKAISIVRGKE